LLELQKKKYKEGITYDQTEKEEWNIEEAEQDDQFNLEELSEITKLLLRINMYGK